MLIHMHLDVCDSTQDALEGHVEGLEPDDNILISTSKQLQGRGRGAHSWEHLAGALAFSFSTTPHPALTWQSLEVAVTLAQFVEQVFGIHLALKWPNDLYHKDKKCGGILLKSRGPRMLIGIGLNVLPDSTWGHLLPSTQGLSKDWQRELPFDFVNHYQARHPLTAEFIREAWNRRCAHMHKTVRITDGEKSFEGQFQGLGAHGEALLKTTQGELAVYNGSLRWQD